MCLAIPSKIVEKSDLVATVDVCGARRSVSLMLLPEEVSIGDFVLVHAGFAMQKVDQTAARQSLEFFGALVEEEKAAGEGETADREMGKVLRRGKITWGKPPGSEP